MKKSQDKHDKEIGHTKHSSSKQEDPHDHSNHGLIMLLAHIIPIGMIIVLPLLGFTGSWTFIIPLLLMVGAHIWMMKAHLTEDKKEVHKI